MKKDNQMTIQELKDRVEKFKTNRNWGKHHTPKNLAMSIAIEAAELMEHFQWDEYTKENREEIESELADVIIYCIHFANTSNIDVSKVVLDKLAHNEKKYPVDIFKKKDNPSIYSKIKRDYRRKRD